MSHITKFANNPSGPDPLSSSDSTKKSNWKSKKFKPDFAKLSHKFKSPQTWLRILPPIQGSSYQWMMAAEVFQSPGEGIEFTEFVHPKTFDKNAPCPFDEARIWFNKNAKDQLANKDTNPNGFKLNPKKIGISWVVDISAEDGERLKLLDKSLYDGSWGGAPGLSCNIWMTANQVETEPGSPDEGKKLYPDISDPKEGRLVGITKTKPDGGSSKFASYSVKIGSKPSNLDKIIEGLTDEEHQLLCPLENVLYQPSYEEQLEFLRAYIGDKWFNQIFPANAELTQQPPQEVQEPKHTEEPQEHEEDELPHLTPTTKEEKPKENKTKDPTYTLSQVSKLIATKSGVEKLIEDWDLLETSHKKVLSEVAKDYNLETPKI